MNEAAWSFFQNAAERITEYIQENAVERHVVKERYSQLTREDHLTGRVNNSWADVARLTQKGKDATHLATPKIEDVKKAKQVTIRIEDSGERTQMAKATFPQLVQTFGGAGGVTGEIIAARRTAGGDIILQTAIVRAREELEKDDGWVRRLYRSARVLRKTVMVAVHGVEKKMDTRDQPGVFETLKRDNKKLHPELEITKAEWPAFAMKPDAYGREKKFSTMIIEVPNPEVANRLISEGMVVENNLLFCDRWEREVAPRQCFNCYGYGHIARVCKHPTRCGVCAQGHTTDDHKEETGGKPKCVVCKGDHPAWSKVCPIRQRENVKARQRIEHKPKFFRETPKQIQERQVPEAQGRANLEGWREVVSKGKRKALGDITAKPQKGTGEVVKRGRPTTLSKAGQGQRSLSIE